MAGPQAKKRPRQRAPHGAAFEAPDEVVDFQVEGSASGSNGSTPSAAGPGFSAFAAFKLIVGGSIVLGITVGLCVSLYQFAITTPRFGIKQVVVEGAHRLSEASILERAGVTVGQNIFVVGVEQVERRLLEDPWIERVRVTRELPSTIKVQIVEHESVALAALGDQLFLLGAQGEPFKPVEHGESLDLPVVTGLSLTGFATDPKREQERAATAIQVLNQYARLEISRAQVAEEVHLADDGSVTLLVGSKGLSLQLGKGPWRTKLLMAVRVLGKLPSRADSPEVVFLDNEEHPERVVVRMR